MKVIITDCDHANIDIEKNVLDKAGISFELKQCITEEDLIEQCQGAEIFINQYAPITRKVMEALPDLKYVVRYGVGVNNVDVAAATELGVQIGNVPDYGMNEVADEAIALMMALTRKIVIMNDYTKNVKWDYARAIPVRRPTTQTVGVMGLGRIGRNFAEKAHAIGYRVIGYDPYYTPSEDKGTGYIKSVSLDELIVQADIISIHCPLTPEVANIFNKETFKKMKNNAYLINVARGGIINEDDLVWAVENGEIAGAGIDCVLHEPMQPGAALLGNENIIVTPHMAWYSEEAAEELKRKVAEESVRFANGEAIVYPVNKLEKSR